MRKALRYDPRGRRLANYEKPQQNVLVLKNGRGRVYDDVGYATSIYSVL